MANCPSPLSRWKEAIILCAAVLFSSGAMADALFGMAAATSTAATPVAIDPITGTETQIVFGAAFTGTTFDMVVSGNTLFLVRNSFPNALFSVDVTTSHIGAVPLAQPVLDMTVGVVEVAQVPELSTMLLLLSALAGLIGIRARHRLSHLPSLGQSIIS
jgi:hypothetical protein